MTVLMVNSLEPGGKGGILFRSFKFFSFKDK